MTTKAIHEANLAEVNDLGENSAEFVIKPLYYGYGNTLGNSLRRVLLSSIKGAAITAFTIEGTNHEFSTVPGVREDVVDIMLNLKNIRFKVHTGRSGGCNTSGGIHLIMQECKCQNTTAYNHCNTDKQRS